MKNSRTIRQVIIYLIFILTSAFIVIVIYQNLIIPKQINTLKRKYDVEYIPKKSIVRASKDIAKYTEIKDDMVEIFPMLEPYTLDGVAQTKEEVVGKMSMVDLKSKEQILSSRVHEYTWDTDDVRVISVDIGADHFVANEVKTGSLVDILVCFPDGSFKVVVSKIGVRERVLPKEDVPGTETVNTNKVKFALSNDEEARLRKAIKVGTIELRLYLNENQEASEVTFNPDDPSFNQIVSTKSSEPKQQQSSIAVDKPTVIKND